MAAALVVFIVPAVELLAVVQALFGRVTTAAGARDAAAVLGVSRTSVVSDTAIAARLAPSVLDYVTAVSNVRVQHAPHALPETVWLESDRNRFQLCLE